MLSSSPFQTPALAAAAQAEVAQAQPFIGLGNLRLGRLSQVTIGGSVSVPVTATGALTIQSFAVTNNQLTATASLNVNGTPTPVTFNVGVTQQGTAAPVMTLTPQAANLNIPGLGTVALNTQTAVTVPASSPLSTLLGQVVTGLGGVTDLNGIATGLNTGLNASNNTLANFGLDGTLNATVGIQRFVTQNGQLAAQVNVGGNQLTLPVDLSASGGNNLALGAATGATVNIGNTGVQVRTGQDVNVPINGPFGRVRQVDNLLNNLERIAGRNPRLTQLFTNQLNRIVRPFTGQNSQPTSLIGGTVSVPVTVSGALTLQNFAVTNNQLTATASLNVNGTPTPVTFNVGVTQQGTAAPVMTLTPQAANLNIPGLGTVALNTQTAVTVPASSPLSTLLGQVVTGLGGVTDLSGIATGLNTGLNASNNTLANFGLNGTLSTNLAVRRFVTQNGQLAAQVNAGGNQFTLPVDLSASGGGTLALGTAGSVNLGNTGVQVQAGQDINLPINAIPGPGNLVVNLLNALGRNPRRVNRIVAQLNQRLLLAQRLFL